MEDAKNIHALMRERFGNFLVDRALQVLYEGKYKTIEEVEAAQDAWVESYNQKLRDKKNAI